MKPVIKDLFVVLKSEPLKGPLPNFKQVNCGSKIPFTELINIYKNHKITYKECTIILEKVDTNALNQLHGKIYQPNLPMENSLFEQYSTKVSTPILDTLDTGQVKKSNDELADLHSSRDKTKKHLVSEKPIYKKIIDHKPQENHDLYEFDEVDSDDLKGVHKTRHNIRKKKVKSSKHMSQVKRKKNKCDKIVGIKSKTCNTYNTKVQDILQKVRRKINKDKGMFDNKSSTPISKETLHNENNMNDMNELQINLSHVIVDSNKSNIQIVEKEKSSSEENKDDEILSENDMDNNNSDFFCVYSPEKSRNKIHVISDIMLDNTDSLSFLNERLEPNANSTTLFSKKCKPWRFGENIKRNPHYLNIKKTALPCLQQDIIIDHLQVEKLEKHFAKATKTVGKGVKKIVRKEPEYLCDAGNKENVSQISLFDSDDFITDPKKLQSGDLVMNKQKRSVLGLKSQNALNIMEGVKVTNTLENQVPFIQEAFELSNIDQEENLALNTSKVDDLKLFEDDEPNINFNESSKIYIPKIRKRKKLLPESNEMVNQDKHKKDAMTKTEKAELERWAAKFNSMCEDIEKYKLEIE